MESISDDLSSYQLIALPTVEYVSPPMQERLKHYVRNGGLLFAEHRLNVRDEFGKYRTSAGPDGMLDLFGVEIHDIAPAFGEHSYWVASLDIPQKSDTLFYLEILGKPSPIRSRMEHLELRTAHTLMDYSDGCFEGTPLLTENAFGNGYACYFGADADLEAHERVFRFLCERRFGKTFPHLPFAVGHIVRGEFAIYTNCSGEPVSFQAPERVQEVLLGCCTGGNVELQAHDVCILKIQGEGSE